MTRKFTRKPKAQATPAAEDFIAGAGQPGGMPSSDSESSDTDSSDTGSFDTISSDASSLPWNQPRVRADVLKVYNLRLPEPYLLKLRFIAENTPGSMHRFCLDALLPAIDAEVERLARR
jgi:hypothetical protein